MTQPYPAMAPLVEPLFNEDWLPRRERSPSPLADALEF